MVGNDDKINVSSVLESFHDVTNDVFIELINCGTVLEKKKEEKKTRDWKFPKIFCDDESTNL